MPFGLVLSLSNRQGVVQGLLFLDEFSDFVGVDSADQPALLGHLARETFTRDQSVKVADGQLRREEVFNFFADDVVEVSDLVRWKDLEMHRHLCYALLVLEL